MKMTDFKVVAILWHDACSYRNEDLENIDDSKGVERLSIGLLRRDTKEYVLIQSDVDPHNMAKSNYCLKIPRSLVIEIYSLGLLEIAEKVKNGGEI